ncbi:MAG: O-antigen ligase family protein [Thermoanaerobaculia bacterium]
MRRTASHRVWLGAAVALVFGLTLSWGLMRFGAAETATLYRLFLLLLIPTLLALLIPPWRATMDLRLMAVGLLGVVLLGLVAVQPTLESLGALHLAVGWIALWLGLWLSLRSSNQRQFLIVVLVLLGALEAFYGLIQSVGGIDYIGDYFRNRGRIATGTLINRNHFAALLNLLLPLALGLLFAARARKRERPATRSESLAKTWIVLLGCSVMGVAVLLSQSRGGTLSLLMTLLFMALLLSMSRRKVSRRGLSGVAAVVLLFLVVGMGAAFGLEALLERFGQLDENLSRVEVYDDTLKMIGDSPLTGVGPGMYRWAFRSYQRTQADRLYDHAHNDYLETAAEWGMPLAALAWSFVLWRFFRSSVLSLSAHDPRQQGLALGAAGALFSILIHSLVDFSLQIPAILMVFACVVALSWSLEAASSRRAAFGPTASVALRVLLIAALLFAGWAVLQRSRAIRAAQPERGVAGLERAVEIDPEAPEHHFLLGMAYRDLPGTGDPISAWTQLRTAVRRNPYAWRYWLELSRMQELMDDANGAEGSLRIAVRLNPSSGVYRWRLANLLLRQGSVDEAVAEVAEAVRLEPQLAEPAFALFLKSGVAEGVIQEMLPADRSALLRLLRTMIALSKQRASVPVMASAKGTDLMAHVWGRLSTEPEPITVDEGRPYIEFLFSSGEYQKSLQAWTELSGVNGLADVDFEQGKNRVWNGAFELELMGSPFGWRIGRNDAFAVSRPPDGGISGTAALEIEFLGAENLDFAEVSQELILQPGETFRLTQKLRSEDLSTDQGVFVEVLARDPSGLLARTEPVLGTRDWAAAEVEFTVPEGSGRVMIRLRRRQSQQIDNRIRGKVWLDSVKIEPVHRSEDLRAGQ